MKKYILITLLLVGISIITHAQADRILYNPERDDIDMFTFMNMMGFDYQKFEFKTDRSPYVNVYIDEYLNDELITSYDHISANKESTAKSHFNLVFTKLDTSTFTLRIYTHSKSDTIEQIQFRIGELGLYRSLQVNKKEFSYTWKTTDFTDNVGPAVEIGKKIPLLYYATAIEENIDGETIDAFCRIPNILNNRNLIENKGKVKHYFEIGMELVEKIE